MKFEINIIFLIKPFFNMTNKSRQKFKYLENEKSFQDEIKKHFSSFLNGFQWRKQENIFLEGESPTLIHLYPLWEPCAILKQQKERLLILNIERKTCMEATCCTATTTKNNHYIKYWKKSMYIRHGNSTNSCQKLIKFSEPSRK